MEKGGGVDDNGRPIPPVISWSDKIQCLFKANTSSNIGYNEGGSFTTANYAILIDMQKLPSFDSLRLFDNHGRRLGPQRDENKREFTVIGQPEISDIMQIIKILV